MKNQWRSIIHCMVVLLLCGCFYGSITVQSNFIPKGNLYTRLSNQNPILLNELRLADDEVSAMAKRQTSFDNFLDVPCTQCYIWGNADDFAVGTILYGDWKLRPGQAIITEDTAIKLFKCCDCIGSLFSMGGKQYTVSGVYKKLGGLWRELAEDGSEAVFVSMEDAPLETPIDFLLFIDSEEIVNKNVVSFNQQMGEKLSTAYLCEDLYEMSRVIQQFPFLSLLVIGVFGALYSFWCLFSIFVRTKRKHFSYQLVLNIILCMLLLLGSFLCIQHQLTIPVGLFESPESLFHPEQYVVLIQDVFHQFNSLGIRSWITNFMLFMTISGILLFLPTVWAGIRAITIVKGLRKIASGRYSEHAER